MTNKSGIGSNVISLPKGGGAVSGIGQTFSPDLFSGTGNFSVPIAVPAGRNGFQPELTIGFSTGSGNGIYGQGWGLSVPGVMRKTSKGLPTYDDNKDVFILSGAEDLIPVQESDLRDETGKKTGTKLRYRPRTEGLFARIEHHKLTAGYNFWKVWSKDGLISYYGYEDKTGIDNAVICDPDDNTKIFSWSLTKTIDPFGNVIIYEYTRERVTDEYHHYDQLYLSVIRYADYEFEENTKYLCSVLFNYETREDVFSEHRAGFEVRTTKRCNKIETYTHPLDDDLPEGYTPNDNNNSILTKTYDLIYIDERVASGELSNDYLPVNGMSMLSRVQVSGHDLNADPAIEKMPPLDFTYTVFNPKDKDFMTFGGKDLPSWSLANPSIELADLDGNGLPDLVEMNGNYIRYWSNLGDGTFSSPRFMKEMPGGISLGDPNVQFMDTNGDGRIDLVSNQPGLSGYYSLNYNGKFDQKSFKPYKTAPSFSFADPEVKLMDLNGDGITDALRNGESFECYYQGEQGWNEMTQTRKQQLTNFPNISFADSRIRLADMSGDGLQDIMMIHDGHVEYWPNKGYGRWGKRVHMHNSPKFPYGYNPARILTGDIDGDGATDIVYVDNNKITIWFNKSGNSWSDPIVIAGTPPVTDMDAVRIADMLGTGTSGILWSYDAGGMMRERMYYLDLTGGIKPYLLNVMDNNMGAITRVEYKSSIKYYIEDNKNPATRWKTTLPFPTLVVSKVEVIDAISEGKLTTEYYYHHGYWDGGEREFRGFGRVDQMDTEDFSRYNDEGLAGTSTFNKVDLKINFSPPMKTRNWFHLGPVGDESGDWQEINFSEEYWNGDPQVLSRPKNMTDMIKTLPRRAKRDAYRTLRGTTLRTELYAQDGTSLQTKPYTVSESLFGLRTEYNPNTDFTDKNGKQTATPYAAYNKAGSGYIFFSYNLCQRSTQWERGSDPMTQFSFTEDYDDYGQPQKQIAIAVPRGKDPLTGKLITGYPSSQAHTGGYLATASQTVFINRDESTQYTTGRVAEAKSFEIQNTGSMSVFALKEAALKALNDETPPTDIALKLLGHSVNYYDGEAFEGESFGEIDRYGALTRSETLVITPEIITDAYTTTPECFKTTSNPNWGAYPDEFKAMLPKNTEEIVFYDFTDNISGWTAYNQTISHTADGRLKAAGTGAWADAHCFQNVETNKNYRVSLDVDLGNIARVKLIIKNTGTGVVLLTKNLWTKGRTMFEFNSLTATNITLIVQRAAAAGPNYYYYLDNVKIEKITDSIESRLGYQYHDGQTAPYIEGFYTITERRKYDFQETISPLPVIKGLVLEMQDPLENTATVEYDHYNILPLKVTDPGGLETEAEYDYRVLQPKQVTEPNGNRVAYGFTPLGLMEKTAVMGKVTETKGDTLEYPGVKLEYDFFNFMNNADPVWVKTIQREVHISDETSPPENKTIEAREYSDGFGRLIQTRTQAEDIIFGDQTFGSSGLPASQAAQNQDAVGIERESSDPMNVVVSGWQVYDNKGRVIEKYEPFFDSGWDFMPPNESQKGEKARMFYDPRGQVIQTLNPDGTMQLVVFGIPNKLNSPPIGKTATTYYPSSWESYTYDANDLGGITHPTESASYSNHWGTPSSVELDALGRQIRTTQRLSTDSNDDVVMKYEFDIRGNLTEVTDALNRTAFEHRYDLANQPLYTDHIDSGEKRVLYDCVGKPIELTDAKGTQIINSFDLLNRPVRVWAKDKTGETLTLRQKLVYGDTSGIGDFVTNNLAGKLYLHYDEAGLSNFIEYDFKGNLLEKTVRVVDDSVLKAVFNGPPTNWAVTAYRVNWEASVTLDTARQSNMEYDALNRVTLLTYPEDINTDRKELIPVYNNAGALESVNFDGTDYVKHIAYNAKGQRLMIALGGNNSPDNEFVMTRYVYDSKTFRLARMKSERYTYDDSLPYEHTYTYNSGTTRQDNAYEYDLNGNIIKIKNRTPDCGLSGTPDQLDRLFSYDPINRLLSATGRESDSQSSNLQWSDPPICGTPNASNCQSYTRNYSYDKMGNIQSLIQTGTNGFTRAFDYVTGKNILDQITDGNSPPNVLSLFSFDNNGNMTVSNTTRKYEWDHLDRMRAYFNQTGTSEPTVYAQYLYDAGGNRIKKLVRTQGGSYESVTYIDGIFEYHKKETGGNTYQKNYSQVMDNKSRIAEIRTGSYPDDIADSIVYNLEDHLGSSNARLDTNGSLIDREEYYPFGDSSLRTWTKKRYRFCGKEKDAESGLYYYGMRYYAAWTCRFISVDPLAGDYAHLTPYNYAGNKPINFTDIDGLQGEGEQQSVQNEPGNFETQENSPQNGVEIEMNGNNTNLWMNPGEYKREEKKETEEKKEENPKKNKSEYKNLVPKYDITTEKGRLEAERAYYEQEAKNLGKTSILEIANYVALRQDIRIFSKFSTEDVIEGIKKNDPSFLYGEITPIDDPYIISEYGEPRKGYTHRGYDIANKTPGEVEGKPIYSMTSGTVVHTDYENRGRSGVQVRIRSNNGYEYAYYHMQVGSNKHLKIGSTVEKGQVIGNVGSTGKGCKGAHLHFEIWSDTLGKDRPDPALNFPYFNNIPRR